MPTLRTAATAAAHCATLGMLHALAAERAERVAIRAVRAMGVALSTSPYYAAFIGAAAAAESVALIVAEDPVGCADWPPEKVARRVQNYFNDALDTMAPETEGNAWPLAFDDDFHLAWSRLRNPSPIRSFDSSPEPPYPAQGVTANLPMFICQLAGL